MDSVEFLDAVRARHRLTSDNKLAKFLKIDQPRVVSYRKRRRKLLVDVMHHGELELVHDAWRGFRLDRRNGTLWTPEDWPCTPGDLLAIKYRAAQLRELERLLAVSDLDRFLSQSAA